MAQQVGSETRDSGDSALGETTTRTIQISGDDGAVFPATVYTSVNVTDDPELLRPLMDGTLNEVESPTEDDRVYRPAVPVIYHDEAREVFALIIPEARRHEEFACRRKLLDELATQQGVVPEYMRRFEVVFDVTRLDELGGGATAGPKEKTELIDAPGVGPDVERLREQLEDKERQIDDLRQHLEEAKQEVEQARRAGQAEQTGEEGRDVQSLDARARELDERARTLEERERQLELEREQLDEVASRVERDSARVEEASRRNEERLAELEHREQEIKDRERKLQVRELNLEQKELEIQKENQLAMAGAGQAPADEGTQVVTDSQFIEIQDVDAHRNQAGAASPQMADSEAAEAARPRRPEPTSRTITPVESEHVAETYPDDRPQDWFVTQTPDLVVAGYAVDDERAQRFADGDVRFLFQLHEVDDIPIIALTLASFNDDGECVDAVTVPLVDRSEQQRSILDKLARDLHLQLAIYGDDATLVGAWEAGSPLRRNIGWARQRLRKWRDSVDEPEAADEAAEKLAGGDVELVGSMRHPFDAQSFADFDGASDVKLAASIVGYWSEPEQFHYLIGNRSYPLEAFLNIQKRVVRQALHWGLAFGGALQKVAIDEAIILDEKSMVQRLLSNFAEVCVGLRANDLDPMEQWENWDVLIEMAEDHGVTPDPDVLELAESSLKRAEEYEKVVEDEVEDDVGVDDGPAVQKKSYEDAGVTYFVPRGQSGDEFAALWDEDRAELETLLEDADLRAVTAQILVERHGSDAVHEVLDSVEGMDAGEVEAVSRFCEERADELEAALVQALDGAGPSATLVAGRALAAIGSAAALPRLLEVVGDNAVNDGKSSLVRCLARFGDKLLPPLSRALKANPDDDALLAVLAALETHREGTLDELAEERSDSLQRAAQRARQLI